MARKKPTASPSERWQAARSVYDLDDLLSRHRKTPPSGEAAIRKRWLFAVAGGRMAWDALPDGPARTAIEVGERAADGRATAAEVKAAVAALNQAVREIARELVRNAKSGWDRSDAWDKGLRFRATALDVARATVTRPDGWGEPGDTAAAINVLIVPYESWDYAHYDLHFDEAADARAAGVFRDLLGDPFDPVRFDKTWLTSAVVGLANTVYDERSFEKLPVLADALEEAGCGDARVLSHCRGGGEHAKGCWVIDGLFGRNWVPRVGR